MIFTKINYEVKDKIAVITLNSPKNLNPFDIDMSEDVVAALKLCEEDKSIKAVVIKGEGKSFSAGGDIGAMYDGIKSGNFEFIGIAEKVAKLSLAIKKLSKPVIASVKGAVAGAAFNVALACDFCIAADNSNFIQAFVNIGLVPDAGGLYLLSRAVGVSKASQLVLTGKPINAKEAFDLGIVCDVCTVEDLEEKTLDFAKKISRGPALAYANMKKLMYVSQFNDFESYIKEEIKAQIECGESEDFKEGIISFVEKRKTEFK